MTKPANVRPFYMEAEIDGRKTTLSGGPRSKTGGMEVNIYQRNEGEIETALSVVCKIYNGELVTRVSNSNGHIIFIHSTEY